MIQCSAKIAPVFLRTPLDWIGAKRGHSCQMQSNLDSKHSPDKQTT
jgi:hypothetical protein